MDRIPLSPPKSYDRSYSETEKHIYLQFLLFCLQFDFFRANIFFKCVWRQVNIQSIILKTILLLLWVLNEMTCWPWSPQLGSKALASAFLHPSVLGLKVPATMWLLLWVLGIRAQSFMLPQSFMLSTDGSVPLVLSTFLFNSNQKFHPFDQ